MAARCGCSKKRLCPQHHLAAQSLEAAFARAEKQQAKPSEPEAPNPTVDESRPREDEETVYAGRPVFEAGADNFDRDLRRWPRGTESVRIDFSRK